MELYCKNCKKQVSTRFTFIQYVLISLSFTCLIIPGIVYCFKHKKMCPFCTLEIYEESILSPASEKIKWSENEDDWFSKIIENTKKKQTN